MAKSKLDWLSKIKVVGWDLDGTLYPSTKELEETIEQAKYELVASDLKLDLEEAREKFDLIYKEVGSNTRVLEELGMVGVDFFTRLWDEIDLKHFIERNEETVSVINNINELGIRQFILSNANRIDQIEKKLGLVGIESRVFEYLGSTVEIGSHKPDPKPFLVCIEKMAVEPDEILFCGDRVSTDIEGAISVGMRSCLVGSESPLADLCVPKPQDVIELLLTKGGK